MAKKLSTAAAVKLLERASYSDDVVSVFAAGLEESDYVVRYVSAIRLCDLRPELLTPLAIGELFLTLNETYRENGHPLPIAEAYAIVTAGSDLQQDTVCALANLRHDQFGRTTVYIPRLIDFFARDRTFYELAHLMLSMAFPNSQVPIRASDITPTQRAVLTALVANDAIWLHDGDLPTLLEAAGLPTNQYEIRALARAESAM